ncbi:MAG: SIMPL domain-containing protein [Deltaproteobacteria bacterium]|nr:SIMPL domain-containing protein [Deltaproteobacteria bacterium]
METNDLRAQEAVRQNAVRTGRLLSRLKDMAGKESKLKTSGFSVSPVYGRENRLRPRGYVARNTVTLETKELDKLGAFIDEAFEAGANRLGGLTFRNDEEAKYKRQAAIEALKQALKDAEGLASAAGVSIKRVFKITYGPRDVPAVRHYLARAETAALAKTPVEIGELRIEASVHVILEIE